MSQLITNFKNNCETFMRVLPEVPGAIGKNLVDQVTVWERTPREDLKTREEQEAQLKEREKVILLCTIVAMASLAMIISNCVGGFSAMGVGGLLMFGTTIVFFLFAMKEMILQKLVREREKKLYNIENESEATQYGVFDLIDVYSNSVRRSAEILKEQLFSLPTQETTDQSKEMSDVASEEPSS